MRSTRSVALPPPYGMFPSHVRCGPGVGSLSPIAWKIATFPSVVVGTGTPSVSRYSQPALSLRMRGPRTLNSFSRYCSQRSGGSQMWPSASTAPHFGKGFGS